MMCPVCHVNELVNPSRKKVTAPVDPATLKCKGCKELFPECSCAKPGVMGPPA